MEKTKDDKDYSDSFKTAYKILQRKNEILKITDFWRALSIVYGLKEFEILNLRSPHTSEFESYLMDVLIEWVKGDKINLSEIEEAIYTFGDFTEMEKLLFESENLQDRIWAIYTYLIDPNKNL